MSEGPDMPEEHDRIQLDDPGPSGGATGTENLFFTGDSQPATKPPEQQSSGSKKLLVCEECVEWYDYSDDWKSCPKCAGDLSEVDKA